jgi:predicted Zn-dependent protease
MEAAIPANQDFIDLRVRAEYLELCGDDEAANRLRNLSLEIAREGDLTSYAYQLLWRDRIDDAIALLRVNAAVHPQSWNVYDSLAEAYEQKGELATAIAWYKIALPLVDDDEARKRLEHRIAVLTL